MNIENKKLCIDCKHCVPRYKGMLWWKEPDPDECLCGKTGDLVADHYCDTCQTQRTDSGDSGLTCGPKAAWFEPKPIKAED